MYEPSWQDVEIVEYAATLILCAACLVLIYVFVNRSCEAIFLTGDDCGVGYGWIGLAAGIFVIGMFSAWKVYRLLKERERSTQTV
ncbi:MAG: hypothetical protein Q7U51_09935 [Methanoregula sp.]|nr:hypothetical protein [Methanoregula sp.]